MSLGPCGGPGAHGQPRQFPCSPPKNALLLKPTLHCSRTFPHHVPPREGEPSFVTRATGTGTAERSGLLLFILCGTVLFSPVPPGLLTLIISNGAPPDTVPSRLPLHTWVSAPLLHTLITPIPTGFQEGAQPQPCSPPTCTTFEWPGHISLTTVGGPSMPLWLPPCPAHLPLCLLLATLS